MCLLKVVLACQVSRENDRLKIMFFGGMPAIFTVTDFKFKGICLVYISVRMVIVPQGSW